MPLPPFNEDEDLPPGVHPCSLREAVERFGTGSTRRMIIASRLQRIVQIARSTGLVSRIIVYGSFVTAKPEPNDVDIFFWMDNSFEFSDLKGEARLVFDHADADAHFGASVFWMRPIGAFDSEQAAIEYWQTRRDGLLRGIVEIFPEEKRS